MGSNRFEELPVWQGAIKLGVETYTLTSGDSFKGQHSLRDQIERAAVSVSNNVAEGFERGTNNELLTFLYIARGSAGEVRSMLRLLEQLPRFNDLKLQAENISRQLRVWADSPQNSDIKGQRYLTDKTRRREKVKREREEFMSGLRRMQEESLRSLENRAAGMRAGCRAKSRRPVNL